MNGLIKEFKILRDKSLEEASYPMDDGSDTCANLTNDAFLGVAFIAVWFIRKTCPNPLRGSALTAIVLLFH